MTYRRRRPFYKRRRYRKRRYFGRGGARSRLDATAAILKLNGSVAAINDIYELTSSINSFGKSAAIIFKAYKKQLPNMTTYGNCCLPALLTLPQDKKSFLRQCKRFKKLLDNARTNGDLTKVAETPMTYQVNESGENKNVSMEPAKNNAFLIWYLYKLRHRPIFQQYKALQMEQHAGGTLFKNLQNTIASINSRIVQQAKNIVPSTIPVNNTVSSYYV